MADQLDAILRRELSQIAWHAIDFGLSHGTKFTPSLNGREKTLIRPGASFVTLKTHDGRLRGCIGTLFSQTPLLVNVSHNAHNAAFSDSRFTPVVKSERNALQLQLSVLSDPKVIEGNSEPEVLEQIRPYTDGLIFREKNRRATFLPAVWGSIPDPVMFLRQLKLKGGFTEDYWSEHVEVLRYTTESW